jgi:ribosome-binding factor A
MRVERIGNQIREEIASLLTFEVKDPGVGLITVTRVRVTADLQLAHVYYTAIGDAAARAATAKALDRALPFLRRQLAGRLRLRRAPELRFHFDESIEQQERVEQLLRDIQAERERRSDSPDDEHGSD